MADTITPFLLLALALLALFAVFWFMSRQGQKRQEGYAAAQALRTTHVAVLASSATIRAVVERMLSSAGIPFTLLDLSRGVTPVLPQEARIAILNVHDLRSAGVLAPAIASQRPVVLLVGPFSVEDRALPTGPGRVQLSKPFTPPELFLALAHAIAADSSHR